MLVQKEALALIEATSQNRLYNTCEAIKITNDTVFATDGHMAFKMALPDQSLLDEYPNVSDIQSTEDIVYLTKDTIKKVAANMPKNPSKPILDYFYIGKNGKPDEINVIMTDLDNHITITQKIDDRRFPDIESPFSDTEKSDPVITISFSVSLLEKMLKIVKKIQDKDDDSIRLKIIDNESPVLVEINDQAKALVMPAKE